MYSILNVMFYQPLRERCVWVSFLIDLKTKVGNRWINSFLRVYFLFYVFRIKHV